MLNADGSVLTQFTVPHTAAGLAELVGGWRAAGLPSVCASGSNVHPGLLVDTLVAAGHPVVPIHPNVIKASRPRYRAAGGKSDSGDAYIVADVVRTDGHRFASLQPPRTRSRPCAPWCARGQIWSETALHLSNQLRALLESFWPGAALIFAEIDSPISLAFLERYPTPESAARLGTQEARCVS